MMYEAFIVLIKEVVGSFASCGQTGFDPYCTNTSQDTRNLLHTL